MYGESAGSLTLRRNSRVLRARFWSLGMTASLISEAIGYLWSEAFLCTFTLQK